MAQQGSLFFGFIVGTLGFALLVAGCIYLMYLYIRRRQQHLLLLKERELQFRNELLVSQVELHEHILTEVSREIHDNVGQVLSLVKLHLYTIAGTVQEPRTQRLLRTSSELLNKAIEDLRLIARSKNPIPVQRSGLEATIRKELEYINLLRRPACTLEVTGSYYSLTSEKELLVYRIVQEALQNCIKHSGAAQVVVQLNYATAMFELRVTDDGKGFETGALAESAGLGLHHIRQHSVLLNGSMHIDSAPGRGTSLIVRIPQNN